MWRTISWYQAEATAAWGLRETVPAHPREIQKRRFSPITEG